LRQIRTLCIFRLSTQKIIDGYVSFINDKNRSILNKLLNATLNEDDDEIRKIFLELNIKYIIFFKYFRGHPWFDYRLEEKSRYLIKT
jgi:hypothetical protein